MKWYGWVIAMSVVIGVSLWLTFLGLGTDVHLGYGFLHFFVGVIVGSIVYGSGYFTKED